MGFGYAGDDTPLMCFSGPKTYELNWFPAYYKTLTEGNLNWSGNLYHPLDEDSIPAGGMMVIKIQGIKEYSDSFGDYYISFNSVSTQNAGTKACENKVAVHSSESQTYISPTKSHRVAELSAGETFDVTVFGKVLNIEVPTINLLATPPYATVNIGPSTTDSPTFSPSDTPTIIPSDTPSDTPTIEGYTAPPTDIVTFAPTDTVTFAPTDIVTFAPTYYSLFTNFLYGEFYAASKSGIMFEILATEDVYIVAFDIDLFYVNYDEITFPTDVEIYTRSGSYTGYEYSKAGWTQNMERTSLMPPQEDDISTLGLTPISSDLLSPIAIPAGGSVSIFITNRDADNFIEMAFNENASDFGDDAITVKKGSFHKYEHFNGDGPDYFR